MARLAPVPDFVLLTGDLLASLSSSNSTLDTLKLVDGEVRTTFDNADTKLLYAVGESEVPLEWRDQPMQDSPWLRQLAAVWNASLTQAGPDALDTFCKGGYYTALVEATGKHRLQREPMNIAVIVINTVLYAAPLVPGTPQVGIEKLEAVTADPAGQLAWLEEELRQARHWGRKVIIAGHRPPGVGDGTETPLWRSSFEKRYARLVVENADVVVGQLFGFLHRGQFRLVRTGPITRFHNFEETPSPLMEKKDDKMPLDITDNDDVREESGEPFAGALTSTPNVQEEKSSTGASITIPRKGVRGNKRGAFGEGDAVERVWGPPFVQHKLPDSLLWSVIGSLGSRFWGGSWASGQPDEFKNRIHDTAASEQASAKNRVSSDSSRERATQESAMRSEEGEERGTGLDSKSEEPQSGFQPHERTTETGLIQLNGVGVELGEEWTSHVRNGRRVALQRRQRQVDESRDGLKSSGTAVPKMPGSAILMAPSLSPMFDNRPAFRLFKYDRWHLLMDYSEHTADLSQQQEGMGTGSWRRAYGARESYRLPSLDPASLEDLSWSFFNDSGTPTAAFHVFCQLRAAGRQPAPGVLECCQACPHHMHCSVESGTFAQYLQCQRRAFPSKKAYSL
eukprot:TRINITY_DN2381_c0_g1_i1.p1 TRINITY_DN2381_c0_g1~~TRINITY_DN2381_c0_g1_i1.p1  ORF type:complete len:671 (+),score=88.78 TRINITY_DN2381_c0_g1_i1:147-2015(+)